MSLRMVCEHKGCNICEACCLRKALANLLADFESVVEDEHQTKDCPDPASSWESVSVARQMVEKNG